MTTLRKWPKISKSLITNGSNTGLVEVRDIAGLYLFQKVSMRSNVIPETKNLQIIEILSNTVVRLGEFSKEKKKILVDLSIYLAVDDSLIFAPSQRMTDIDYETIIQETFERFPVDAWRMVPVNDKGELISENNRLPVSSTSNFCVNDIDETVQFTYIGSSSLSGDWIIQRFEQLVGGDEEIRYASMTVNPAIIIYDNAWDNRLVLTYTRKHGQFLEGNLLTELGDALVTEGGDNIVL